MTNNGEFVIGNYGSGMLTVSAGAVVGTTIPTGSGFHGADRWSVFRLNRGSFGDVR